MRTSRWVLVTYIAIIVFGLFAALPNILSSRQLEAWPSWLPGRQIALGLDLRGGAHLVLEVDGAALKRDRLRALQDDVRGLLRSEKIPFQSVRTAPEAVVIALQDDASRERATAALRSLTSPASGPAASERDLDISSTGRQIQIALTEAGLRDRLSAALQQSMEIVRQRVDQVGVSEPTIQRVGPDRLLVQLPGLQDPSRLRALLGSTARLTFQMVANAGSTDALPRGVSLLPDSKGAAQYPVEDRVALSGERLADARAGFDAHTGEPIVSFRFDSVGARQFSEITTAEVGRPFAIVLDGKVLAAPVIREPITGGSGQISGHFTVEDTVVLSALLRAGALPAPLTVIEERTVGPDLGGDVIRMGLVTGIAGFALVAALMFVLYRGWGLIVNVALGLNVILTIGALSLLGATLTLPGIAGIILGIGLAVDANILINERIREESRKGASAFAALDHGFRHAYSTIVDANVTALIVTTLLFAFGSGPVRGFAVTMGLGVCISMFTAVTVVRVLMQEVVRHRRMKTIHMEPLFRLVPEGTHVSFMKARFLGIAVSAFLSVASLVLFVIPGLNYGIDFKGGIQMEMVTPQPADLSALRARLSALDLGEVTLQNVGGDRNILVRLQRQEGGEAAQLAAVEKVKSEIFQIAPDAHFERTDIVGPKVSGELAQSGVLAVLFACLAVVAYIWWRFEWNFAVGAIATLVLDVTKTIGFFALLGIDFNLTAIAALLTIIGYSVNDKVVVYDRMRENLRLYKRMPLRELIDLSINQVLTRCIYTSFASFLCMLPMAVWGGSAVANFAVPLVFGIVVATSSSIFIAAPILLFLGDWWRRRNETRSSAGVVRPAKT